MSKLFFKWFWIWLSVLPQWSFAKDWSSYSLSEKSPAIGKYFSYSYLDSGDFSVSEFLETDAFDWQQSNKDILNLGYKKPAVLVAFRTFNDTQQKDWVITLDYPLMQHIEIYRIQAGKVIDSKISAKSLATVERDVVHTAHAFHFEIPPGSTDLWFLKVKTTGAMNIPVSISQEAEFSYQRNQRYFFFSIYFGGIIFLSLYNIFLFFKIKENSHLIYFFYGICLCFVHMSLFGYTQEFLPKSWDHLKDVSVPVSINTMFGFLLLFTLYYVEKNSLKRWPRALLLTVASVNFVTGIVAYFAYGSTINMITGLTGILSPLVVIISAISAIINGSYLARYLFVAVAFFMSFSVVYGLKDFGIIPNNSFTQYGILLASSAEMLLLSFGIGEKMARLQSHVAKLSLSNEKNQAIAQVTQMLAHDVRKPFTMIQGIIDMIMTSTPGDTKEIARDLMPEVNRSLRTVNGMIADVMEIGSNTSLHQEPAILESLLLNVLNDNLRFVQEANVSISYKLAHKHQVFADTLKLERVLSNIIGNGLQAMKYKGQLWIHSQEQDGSITITLGNSDSYIAPADLKNLFEMFFTKGKKGGTGLGLAIAKKVVLAHGGKIGCTSDPIKGTEFYFSLPICSEVNRFDGVLPISAAEIRSRFDVVYTGSGHKKTEDLSGAMSVAKLVESVRDEIHEPVKILVCDDESVYRNLLESYVSCEDSLKNKVEIYTVSSGQKALEVCKQLKPDAIIMDVDLGHEEESGFDIVKRLRSEGSKSKICIHSNRGALEYQKNAVEAGADLFMPKPMNKAHLLSIVLGAIPKRMPKDRSFVKSEGFYVVVDDSLIMLLSWKQRLQAFGEVKIFQSPEEFWQAIAQKDVQLLKVKAVISDHNYGQLSFKTGLEFAEDLRDHGFEHPIFLATDDDIADAELQLPRVVKVPELAKVAVDMIVDHLRKGERSP